jgi:choline dehydrogenase-like flavoprotein
MQNRSLAGVADAGVVGAGVAGLAAALTLRRHRRSVLVFDGGPARNYWVRRVHGVLGLPEISGQELHRLGRQQVADVGAQLVDAHIAEVRRQDDAFLVCAADGRSWRVERVVLATGVRDVYSDIDVLLTHVEQLAAWGQSSIVWPGQGWRPWNGMCRYTHASAQKTRARSGGSMPAALRQRRVTTCKNCDRPAPKLGRLNIVRPTGKRFTLLVCRFCYLQLSSEARPRLP